MCRINIYTKASCTETFLSNVHSIFSAGGCTCEFLVPSLVCAELSRVKFSSTSGSPAVDTFAWLRENTSGSALRRPVRPVRTKSLMVTPQSPEGHSAILFFTWPRSQPSRRGFCGFRPVKSRQNPGEIREVFSVIFHNKT